MSRHRRISWVRKIPCEPDVYNLGGRDTNSMSVILDNIR